MKITLRKEPGHGTLECIRPEYPDWRFSNHFTCKKIYQVKY